MLLFERNENYPPYPLLFERSENYLVRIVVDSSEFSGSSPRTIRGDDRGIHYCSSESENFLLFEEYPP